ncbi:SIS domain-containing protein, partial [Candidatus Dependentiae bacterium]|nr:SIS domain-containing protein [Candidatus Dependentiae bacterium]
MGTHLEHAQSIVPGTNSDNFITNINQQLQDILLKEAHALGLVYKFLPENSYLLVQAMLNTTGRIVFSGTGKSGLVAKKLVATCAGLGIPSFFLHPHEALHGDLGMIMQGDLFIALSKSGTGTELSIITTTLRSMGVTTALICCSQGSLTREVEIPIILPFEQEACPLNLAPTSSSTVTMA